MKKPFKNQTTNIFWALSVKHILYYTMCVAYTDLSFTVKGFRNLKFGSAWVTHDILSCSAIDHKAEWGGSQGVIPFWKQSTEERGTLIATPRLYAWHLVATPGITVLDCRGWLLTHSRSEEAEVKMHSHQLPLSVLDLPLIFFFILHFLNMILNNHLVLELVGSHTTFV